MTESPGDKAASRAVMRGKVQGVGFRDATVRRARALGLTGWVRNSEDGSVVVHAEGPQGALEELIGFLRAGPRLSRVDAVACDSVPVEGHEQFAIRGVSAGAFVVHERTGARRHFDLCLQVGGAVRSWTLPRGPTLDPAAKRLAIEAPPSADPVDLLEGADATGGAIVWDHGPYEQGGRVAWPEAISRGHAVFVLHGMKLRGGFALQRTRVGPPAQWLLVKRADDEARPGSDVVSEYPRSAVSGRTLDEVLE